MAPRFKVNMYKIWKKKQITECLICFSSNSIYQIFSFRDLLAKYIAEDKNFKLIKEEGSPNDYDSIIYFFTENDIRPCLDKYNQEFPKFPGFIHLIFRTKKYKEYKLRLSSIIKARQDLEEMAKIIIYTSHDHPCIEIYAKVDFEKDLENYIKNAEIKLGIKIYKNEDLSSMRDIICSNKSYDI